MKYRVLWAPFAEDGLKDLLEAAPEPGVVAAAAREIDAYLINSPPLLANPATIPCGSALSSLLAYNSK